MIPIFILQIWLLGLLSLGIVVGAVYLAYEWQQRSWQWNPVLKECIFTPDFGLNQETMFLAAAMILTLVALAGGTIVNTILKVTSSGKAVRTTDPRRTPPPASQQRLARPDGSELQVEFYGPEDGSPIVLTHGWGLDTREWNYLKPNLSDSFRLIVWDEPGLGKSTRPANRDYALENPRAILKRSSRLRAIGQQSCSDTASAE
jgi:alpha/beta hydrolase family protein